MILNSELENLFLNVSSRAALSSYHLVGKKDKIAADKAAVDTMRNELNKINMKGQIVIGEGELDEAPMLFIGEKLGNNNGPELDIAVDPLEGTNFAANNLPGALSVIAVANKSNLFNAPETYMNKISANVNEENIIVIWPNKNTYELFKDVAPEVLDDLDFDLANNFKKHIIHYVDSKSGCICVRSVSWDALYVC